VLIIEVYISEFRLYICNLSLYMKKVRNVYINLKKKWYNCEIKKSQLLRFYSVVETSFHSRVI